MILLSQWYEPDDADRLAELKSVRDSNSSSGVFSDACYVEPERDGRLTFGDLFSFAASNFPGQVCVVANTDILFHASAALLEGECRPNRIVALTRWEFPYLTPRMLGHLVGGHFFSGTQDVWAFVAGTLPELTDRIPLGVVGCDQCVIGWAASSGVEVINPSLAIKSFHVHKTAPSHEGCMNGLYGYPEPTDIADKYRGLVLLHEWPLGESGRGKVIETCRA